LIKTPEPILPLRRAVLEATVQQARENVAGLTAKLLDSVRAILKMRQELLRHRALGAATPPKAPATIKDLSQLQKQGSGQSPQSFGPIRAELEWLVGPDFLQRTPYERLSDLPRYLKALLVRADRALLNPGKDLEKAQRVQPYVEESQKLSARTDLSAAAREQLENYRWLVEEFKISVFAQELGTAQPVSPKRLDSALEAIKREIH
jgi:ATP-dependent helicase HrpA